MNNECEELHTIAVSIMRNAKVGVIIDNTLETAMTDFKDIYVTTQLIPKPLQKYKRVVSRVLDGEVAHEAGHLVVTAPIKDRLKAWIMSQSDRQLANMAHQVIEDKRVNHFIMQRYRFDFAHRLKLLADVSLSLWQDTLRLKLAEIRNSSPQNALLPEETLIEAILTPLALLKGMWGIDVEKEFKLSASQKTYIEAIRKILEDASYDHMTMQIVARHQELYDVMEKQQQKGKEDLGQTCPRSLGGGMKAQAGVMTAKTMKKMEKGFEKAEKEAEKEAERENKGKKGKDGKEEGNSSSICAGSGSGLNLPTPKSNEPEYNRIVQKNREHIERLLNLLKRLQKPNLKIERFRKQGRFMTEILGKALAQSNTQPVNDIYSKRSLLMDKAEACIGLIVDLSGSVNIEEAKDALTVISEVCGRWLRDEDFGIMVFGSECQKIKAYVEPYHTTRYRIGGLECLGGTVLYQPLNELYKMMRAQHNSRSKVCMIVSDFCVDEEQKCKDLIKTMEKDGISVIGLGIDQTNERRIKAFCEKARYIGQIHELPEAVFDLYREVAF